MNCLLPSMMAFLQADGEVNAVHIEGWAPLHDAAFDGHLKWRNCSLGPIQVRLGRDAFRPVNPMLCARWTPLGHCGPDLQYV